MKKKKTLFLHTAAGTLLITDYQNKNTQRSLLNDTVYSFMNKKSNAVI